MSPALIFSKPIFDWEKCSLKNHIHVIAFQRNLKTKKRRKKKWNPQRRWLEVRVKISSQTKRRWSKNFSRIKVDRLFKRKLNIAAKNEIRETLGKKEYVTLEHMFGLPLWGLPLIKIINVNTRAIIGKQLRFTTQVLHFTILWIYYKLINLRLILLSHFIKGPTIFARKLCQSCRPI